MKSSEIDFFDKNIFGESEVSTAKYEELKEALMQDKDLCQYMEKDSFRRELSWRWSCGKKGHKATISIMFTTQGEPVGMILLGQLTRELTGREQRNMAGWMKDMKSRFRKRGVEDFYAMKFLYGLQITSAFSVDDSPKKILDQLKMMYAFLQTDQMARKLKQITNGAYKEYTQFDDEDVCPFVKPAEAE